MGPGRPSALELISINHQVGSEISHDAVINNFASKRLFFVVFFYLFFGTYVWN